MLAVRGNVATIFAMTTEGNLGSERPIDAPIDGGDIDFTLTADTAAHQKIINASESDEPFGQAPRIWLRQVLGLRAGDEAVITGEQFLQLRQHHIPELVDVLYTLRQAAGVPGELIEGQRLRFGLFLAGEDDRDISNDYDMSASKVRQERKSFADYLNGGEANYLPSETRANITEARNRVLAAILGPAAVQGQPAPTVQRQHKVETAPASPRQIKIYPAHDILEDVENVYIERRVLPPFGGLLAHHFLDTDREMSKELRNAIGTTLRSMSYSLEQKVLKYQHTLVAVHTSPKLQDAVDFLRTFVSARGGTIPPGRATYVKKFRDRMTDIDEATRAEKNAADDRRLSLALSWLYGTDQPSAQTSPENDDSPSDAPPQVS